MTLKHWLCSGVALLSSLVAFSAPARGAEELNLFAWSEYVPQSVIDGFTKETGIKVNYETYASNEEMLGKLLVGANQYDLVQPSEYATEALIKAGKLAEIDHAKLANYKNLLPEYTKLAHDPDNKYSIPWMTGSVGIIVNTEKVKEPVKGFKDVFSGKYKDRIIALDDGREIASWVMATQKIDINAINEENLAKIKPTMKDWMSQIKAYDSDSPKTSLLNGDTDIGIVWSGEGALLIKENKKFQWVMPEEGTHQFIDTLAIPKDAPHKEAALKFLDYILRPEVSKMISDEFPYTNPNGEARKLLSDEQKNNPASYPAGEMKLELFHDIGKQAELVDTLYTNLKG